MRQDGVTEVVFALPLSHGHDSQVRMRDDVTNVTSAHAQCPVIHKPFWRFGPLDVDDLITKNNFAKHIPFLHQLILTCHIVLPIYAGNIKSWYYSS